MGQFLQIPYNDSFKEVEDFEDYKDKYNFKEKLNNDVYNENLDYPIVEKFNEYEEYDKYEEYEEINQEKIKYIHTIYQHQYQYKIDYILNVELVEEIVNSNYLEDNHGSFLNIV
jgi:hypothetical protein